MANTSRLFIPATPGLITGSTGTTSLGFSESTRRIETVFQALEAATLTKLWHFCSSAVSPPVLRISLQGVDTTTGLPDGTIKGATNNALATFTPTSNAGSWLTLGESYTCTRGEYLAIVIEYSSGTIDASHTASINYAFNGNANRTFDYVITTVSGTRTRSTNMPVFGYASNTRSYGRPLTAQGTITYNSGSSPNEYALRFVVPSGAMTSYTIAGARLIFSPNPASSTCTISLYDGTTALHSYTFDTDVASTSAAVPRVIDVLFTDSSLTTLSPGNTYRIGITTASGTNTNLLNLSVLLNADLDAVFCGKEWYQSSRTGAGAWTDLTTSRPYIVPIFGDFTASSNIFAPPLPMVVQPSTLYLK